MDNRVLRTVIAALQEDEGEDEEFITIYTMFVDLVLAYLNTSSASIAITTEALLGAGMTAFDYFYSHAASEGFQKYFRYDRATFNDLLALVTPLYLNFYYHSCSLSSLLSPLSSLLSPLSFLINHFSFLISHLIFHLKFLYYLYNIYFFYYIKYTILANSEHI